MVVISIPQEGADGRGVAEPNQRAQEKNQNVAAVVAPEDPEGAGDESPTPLRELRPLARHEGDCKNREPGRGQVSDDDAYRVLSFVAYCDITVNEQFVRVKYSTI